MVEETDPRRRAARSVSTGAEARSCTTARTLEPRTPTAAQPRRAAPPQTGSHPRPGTHAGIASAFGGPEVGRGRCQTGV